MGVFKRGNKLWITFKDAGGKWRNVPSGNRVGEERQAQAKYDELVRRVREIGPTDGVVGVRTVKAYAEQWLEERRKLDHDWKSDRARLQHVLPAIGDLAIGDVRPRHLIDAFNRIRTADDPIAQRTVYNVYAVLCAMFRDAKLAELFDGDSPCLLDERQLGPKVDKDPEWRSSALFTRDEAVTLISTPKIPLDRRVLYAFMLLAGMRPGEASALRWRHYDASAAPLGRLVVALAYDSRRHREKSTKTDATRYVPVHPTLAAILAEWRLGGWVDMMGRQPTPDDLIVPMPPAAAAARRTRDGEPFRDEPYNGKRWRQDDQPALGWRAREMYSMKATFITLVLDDGADPHIIETRVTHTKKSRSAFDGYNRGRQWEITCAEVAKLRVFRQLETAAVPIAVGDEGALLTGVLTAAASRGDDVDLGLRRRASNAPRLDHHASSRSESSHLSVVPRSPTVTDDEIAVVAPYSEDPVSRALVAASTAWDARRDPRALRRALLQIAAQLDD